MRLAAALVRSRFVLCALALAGCERPLVDPLDQPIETVGVDLGEVQTSSTLTLGLRVRGATALTINGDTAAFDAGVGVFSETLTLERGVNRIAVRASDPSGVVGVDTLVALYLPLVAEPSLAFALPTPRTEAAVVPVPVNRVLVTGGIGPTGAALASMAVLLPAGPRFTVTEVPLLTARAGHTASTLPDGGTLLIGGATAETPSQAADFVPTAEWIPAGSLQSRPVALPAGPSLRAGHTARVLETGGRVTLYVYGGLVPAGAGVAASGTVDVFEWLQGTARLVRLSPDGGAGSFSPSAGHVQIPLSASSSVGTGRITDVVFGGAVAFRFDFTAPGLNYPFDFAARDAAPLSVPRTDAAGALLGDGLALVAGGRDAAGATLGSLEVYAAEVNRTFRMPESTRLAAPRFGAGATLLPDGRILVVGGRTSSGVASGVVEVFSQ